VALVASDESGRVRLWLRDLGSARLQPLPQTEDASFPFWSPDSRSLGFFSDGRLHRLDLAGGPPRLICEAPFLETLPSWGSSGEILFAQIGPKDPGIYVVSASGGAARRLLYSEGEENFGMWPHFLPDGRRFLYVYRSFEQTEDRRWYIRAGSLDSKETTPIADNIWSRVEYVEPGYLVYGRQGALLAQPFDEKTLRLSGDAVTLAEHVFYFNGPAMTGFSTSQESAISYEKLPPPNRVVWVDRSGREVEVVPLTGIVGSIRLSPDGRRIAAHVRDEKNGTADIWAYDFGRKLPLRLTLDEGDDQTPVWSGDGTNVYFRGDRRGPPDLYEIPLSSPGRDTLLRQRPGVQHPEDASPDGRFLVFTEYSRRTNGDLYLLPLSGGGEPRPLEQSPFDERDARFSPDGRWIAYVSNESGAREIYLRPLEGGGERIRVSTRGGENPRWRRDGKELFYMSGGADIVAVPMHWGKTPEPGAPVVLFRVEGELQDYDVEASGQRFVVDLASPDPAPIGVLVNWPALLPKSKAP